MTTHVPTSAPTPKAWVMFVAGAISALTVEFVAIAILIAMASWKPSPIDLALPVFPREATQTPSPSPTATRTPTPTPTPTPTTTATVTVTPTATRAATPETITVATAKSLAEGEHRSTNCGPESKIEEMITSIFPGLTDWLWPEGVVEVDYSAFSWGEGENVCFLILNKDETQIYFPAEEEEGFIVYYLEASR